MIEDNRRILNEYFGGTYARTDAEAMQYKILAAAEKSVKLLTDNILARDEPHEIFYMQLSDNGENIRKWSRSPFDGGRKCRVEIKP